MAFKTEIEKEKQEREEQHTDSQERDYFHAKNNG
jgi:hypothetical protein